MIVVGYFVLVSLIFQGIPKVSFFVGVHVLTRHSRVVEVCVHIFRVIEVVLVVYLLGLALFQELHLALAVRVVVSEIDVLNIEIVLLLLLQLDVSLLLLTLSVFSFFLDGPAVYPVCLVPRVVGHIKVT